ncbi:MAG: hypothetical protein QM783_01200 [Phycisphaerales bacterium]
MKKIAALFVFAGLAAAAQAQSFVFSGPYNSDGADNGGANGQASFSYIGAGGLGTWSFSGTATSGGVGSYQNELRVRIVNNTNAQTGTGGAMSAVQTWTGGASLGTTIAASNGLWNMSAGDSVTARFWESYDDTGVDAAWTGITLTFTPYVAPAAPSSVFLGSFTSAASFTMVSSGTTGSDTVMALFNSQGLVIATNDDDGPDAFSQIVNSLTDGTYYLGVVEYSSAAGGTGGAGPGFAMMGGDAAIASLGVSVTDGVSTLSASGQSLAVGGVQWYSFSVPTPGAAALLGLGGLAAARRRR